MNGCDPLPLTTAVNTLAAMLAASLNDQELALMSAILVQLGDSMNTIAAQRGLCKSICCSEAK